MSTLKAAPCEDPVIAAGPCLDELPYRALVFVRHSPHRVPLYQVAGSAAPPFGARKALKEAHRLHGGNCFYCRKAVAAGELTIDHAEPEAAGGRHDVQNLLIACRRCNSAKGHEAIELYSPEAGREWLSAVMTQLQRRLSRL